MGSAVLYHLAARGLKALGIDRFDIPNEMGSSHGVTRIIRLAYYEDPSYVPLLRRAYEHWRALEAEAGEALLITTGSIDAGPADSQVFDGSRKSCEVHGLPHQVMNGHEANARFPGLRLPPEHMALFQPDGGFLLPERCIVAHVAGAVRRGAQVRGRERVSGWKASDAGVEVTTDRGRYNAEKLVLCSGAWTGALAPELSPLLVAERQVLGWFKPFREELFTPEALPVFNLLVDEGRFYGFPIYGVPGFKVGKYHHLGQAVDPDHLDREVHPEDEEVLLEFTRRYFPDAAGPVLSLKTCMFTNTPDEHFILDSHPDSPQAYVAAGFSGHGFKFCSVVGEIMADMIQQDSSGHDLGLFRLSRFHESANESKGGPTGELG